MVDFNASLNHARKNNIGHIAYLADEEEGNAVPAMPAVPAAGRRQAGDLLAEIHIEQINKSRWENFIHRLKMYRWSLASF